MTSGALRRFVRRTGQAATVLLITAALAEGTLALLRHVPAFARIPGFGSLGRELYLGDRMLVTISDECGAWDPDLGYRLKPGGCTFVNTEFRTRIRVNSAGLRGAEEALDAPEIIVLGDSFAMGWGVEESEAFPEELGELSGRRVLNAGLASFGTVRELRLLSRLDRRALKTVVIQFCNNDYVENEAWTRNGNRLPPLSREDWEGWIRFNAGYRRYLPGTYLARMLGPRLRSLLRRPLPVATSPDPDDPTVRQNQVAYFLNALATSPVDLSPFRIVLFEVNGRNENADWFLPMLRQRIERDEVPPQARRLVLVDVAARLTRDDFFLLDEHLNAAGHRKVAEILLPRVSAP